MMNRSAIVVASVVMLVGAVPAFAQKANVWIAPGLAVASAKHLDSPMGLMGGFVFQRRPHYVAARGMFLLSKSDDVIGELDLLYGRTAISAPARATVATGVSVVSFDACPGDDDPCFVLGLPVIAEFGLNTKMAGVGVQTFANINANAIYAGVGGFLQFGWMP